MVSTGIGIYFNLMCVTNGHSRYLSKKHVLYIQINNYITYLASKFNILYLSYCRVFQVSKYLTKTTDRENNKQTGTTANPNREDRSTNAPGQLNRGTKGCATGRQELHPWLIM